MLKTTINQSEKKFEVKGHAATPTELTIQWEATIMTAQTTMKFPDKKITDDAKIKSNKK